MRRNSITVMAFLLALIIPLFTGCVEQGKEGERSETEVKKMVAQFPNKEIRLICPPKQGGLSDFITRTLAFFVEKETGAKVVVENRPGAAGATGMRFGAAARSDGYTVTYVTVESTILKHRKDIEETVSYSDFELLARLNYGPASLSVKADSPWQTFSDFINHAKANPGKLNVGNSGQYSIWHLAAAVMADALGVKFSYVPYDGAAPSIQDLLGGHLDAVVSSPSEVFTFVKSGQLRLLAILGHERDPQFPGVPTAKELGHNVIVGAWGGLGVPKGTPRGIGNILYKKFKAGFDAPGFRQKCKERSVTLGWQDFQAFGSFAKAQDEMFARILGSLSME